VLGYVNRRKAKGNMKPGYKKKISKKKPIQPPEPSSNNIVVHKEALA